jgi:YVTN family beta-propeller protein
LGASGGGVVGRPRAVALDSKTHRVYVANTHSDTVSVIDGALNKVVSTVKTGKAPYAIAVDRETNKAYVATMTGGVTVIDGNTLTATPAIPPATKQ